MSEQEKKSYSSFNEWFDAVKTHKCEKKQLLAMDDPYRREIGVECSGCGQEFFIGLVALRQSYVDGKVSPEHKNLLKTPEGRIKLLNEMM